MASFCYSSLLIYRLRSLTNPLLPPLYSFSSSPLIRPHLSMMSEKRCSQEDDCSSLLSRLGSDSPRPRMKFGGMFCNVEGAFENKTLNFESFSPQMQRHRATRTQTHSQDGGEAARGRTAVFPSGHARETYGQREVNKRFLTAQLM